jgi:transcriptional regulator GlxA family with amidase domain
MRIDVIIYAGFDELDAIGPYEVFGHAARAGADIDVAYAAAGRAPGDLVTASLGTTLQVQRTLGAADVVVVPGGGWQNAGTTPGTRAEVIHGDLPCALVERHRAGSLVASVCTGAMLLAEAGLLDGRRAVTHHSAIEDLPGYGVEVVRERVVDDGDIVTAGGVTSGIDLALHLVERLCGAEYADAAAAMMEHTRVRAGAEVG